MTKDLIGKYLTKYTNIASLYTTHKISKEFREVIKLVIQDEPTQAFNKCRKDFESTDEICGTLITAIGKIYDKKVKPLFPINQVPRWEY